jgi:hypothetical protein
MKQLIKIILVLSFLTFPLLANSGKEIAQQLKLNASSKASIQWETVFKKNRKMRRLGIDKLNDADKLALKEYLTNHAADSDAPEAAGI